MNIQSPFSISLLIGLGAGIALFIALQNIAIALPVALGTVWLVYTLRTRPTTQNKQDD